MADSVYLSFQFEKDNHSLLTTQEICEKIQVERLYFERIAHFF